jgi:hypothetical protein
MVEINRIKRKRLTSTFGKGTTKSTRSVGTDRVGTKYKEEKENRQGVKKP